MKKMLIAPALATTVVLSEFSELLQHVQLHHPWAQVSVPVLERQMWHSHTETQTGPWINVHREISAGGGAVMPDVYRLRLRPARGQDTNGKPVLLGVHLVGLPSFSWGSQLMYGTLTNTGELTSALSTKLYLPDLQVASIQRDLLTGVEIEIGGSHSGVIRTFGEASLRDIGMSFRQPDV